TAALALNGGGITDLGGSAAVLTLSTPATGTDGLATRNIVIQTVAADQADLGPNNDTAAGFTIYGGVVNEAYSYTISDSAPGSATKTGSGTLASTSQDVPPIDVSALPAGTLTYTVTLANNPSAPLTATASLKIAPSGYVVTLDQSSYNLTTGQSAGFTVTNAAVGTTLDYLVAGTLSGYVNNNVPVTSTAPQHITGIDIASFDTSVNGPTTVTFDIKLIDSAGNIGVENINFATLNRAVPAAFTIAVNPTAITTATETNTSFTFAGTTAATTYSYTVTSSGGPGSVSGSGPFSGAGQTVSGIDVSSLPDGTLTYSVTLTNSVGNTTTETATADLKTAPTAIELSTSVVPSNATVGTQVALLQTIGAQPNDTATYNYSLVSGAGSTDNGSFQISGNELQTNAAFSSTAQSSYSIRIRSTDADADADGKFVEQQFLITVSDTDPITPTVSPSSFSIAADQTGAGAAVGTLTTTPAAGGVVGSEVNYTLVSGTGSTDNSSFMMGANGQLQTAGPLSAGTSYTVRVRSSSTFLISDVVDLNGVTGPYSFQVTLDPTQLPTGGFAQIAADAGLITLSSESTGGSWNPAVTANTGASGSLAQPNYLGSYASFWSSVTAANPSATVADVLGSSGIDLAANAAWAVVDHSGSYAVGVQVYTEQILTIHVT
ncbi:MAG: cadherin repeat domain-containing protein, partial [Thermoguttaceae bacterium]